MKENVSGCFFLNTVYIAVKTQYCSERWNLGNNQHCRKTYGHPQRCSSSDVG